MRLCGLYYKTRAFFAKIKVKAAAFADGAETAFSYCECGKNG
ncbi:protein of unknown function [Ruminococcaceae bacterium BL-4]|jgi:hypothetical protein|nr:protein of unknown function [Ruminococcaceae bacterium BL-4]